MTAQPYSKRWIIASALAIIATSAVGCKSNSIAPHQHGARAVSGPTTSSAVGEMTGAVAEQGRSAYDNGVKQANETYSEVNQAASKAANDLKAGAQKAQGEFSQAAQQKMQGIRQSSSQAMSDMQTEARAKAHQATDSLIDAVAPAPSAGTKPADVPDVVLPDATTGQP